MAINRFEWTDSHELGHPQMDEPHRMIFTHINTAIEKINKNPNMPKASLGLCFSTINAQVKEHFAREELIMARVDYPKTDQHREAHRKILEEFGELVEVGNFEGSISVIGGWFSKHTLIEDKEFALHLDSVMNT